MQAIRVERQIGGQTLAIETGTFAKLADGSVTVPEVLRPYMGGLAALRP